MEMSRLKNRVASFNSWLKDQECQRGVDNDSCQHARKGLPVSFSNRTSFTKLARAGFYYSKLQGVRCFQCGVEYHIWDEESAVGVHRTLNPDCPFFNPDNSDAFDIIEQLFDTNDISSPSESQSPNHSCTHTQHPSDGDCTPENSPRRVDHAADTMAAIKTPSSHDASNTSAILQLESVKRNLFPRERNNPSRDLITKIERTIHRLINEVKLSHHSDEFSGKIIHPKIGDKKLMVRESFRLLTYPDPTDPKSEEWAENGFKYEEEDRVKCVYCGGCASFNENSIKNIHQRISPKGRYCCPLVSGIDVGDVTRELEKLVRKKLCNKNNEMVCEKNLYSMLHPQYKSVEIRLETFQFWSKQYKQTKDVLSQCGFFHTGVGNKIVCFCCGIAIIDWESTADPWIQHALVSPQCSFIKYEKGEEFIKEMAAMEVLVDLDPKVTEPVSKIGNLVIPDPYPATLTTELLTSFSSCGYSTQLLFHLVAQFFKHTNGRYPNISMLKAAELANDDYKKQVDINDLQTELIEKNAKQFNQLEHVMTTKDQLTKTTVATINQQHSVELYNKDLEVILKDWQCEQKDQELHHKDQELHHKDQELHYERQQQHHKDQELHHKDQELHHKDQELHHKDQELHHERQQLHQKNRQNLLLHCTRQQLRHQLEDQANVIDQQQDQLEELTSRLQTAVSRHEEREITLIQQRNDYMTLSLDIEQQKHEIEEEIKKYEKELSKLSAEYCRLKKQARGDKPVNPDSKRICLFCLTEEKIIMFKPCRHICCCMNCLPNFKNKPCPLCRVHIQGWQVVYLS